MLEENINHEFRWNKINEIRNYLIKEINQNELMNKNHQKVCTVLNYINHSLVSNSTITGCVSITLVGISIGIASSTIGLKICVITAGIKKYKSMIKKKRRKNNKIVLLAKSKLNSIEVLIFETLTDLNISQDEFLLINNVLKELYDMKEEIKNSNK